MVVNSSGESKQDGKQCSQAIELSIENKELIKVSFFDDSNAPAKTTDFIEYWSAQSEVAGMDTKLGPSGIEELGDIPWGSHFCLFYETKEDLLDIVIPYFVQGLENLEFCLWVAATPVELEEAKQAMREAISDFERYLTNESAPEELITAVRKVAYSEKHNTPALVEVLVVDRDQNYERAYESLSDREFQILCMLATGKSPTEIGKELSISIKTVSTYRARLMSKLQLKNMVELIRYAIKRALVINICAQA